MIWFSGTCIAGILIAMLCAVAIESEFFPPARRARQMLEAG
jgi:hypothetical protein